MTWCRRSYGGESPELAESLLKHGRYTPSPAQDVWAFGLAMLNALCGDMPAQQLKLMTSPEYAAELRKGNRLPTYLQYLAACTTAAVPYSDQVSTVYLPHRRLVRQGFVSACCKCLHTC